MTYSPETPACQHVQRWLDDMVIGHNFCPFARFVRDQERIRFVDIASSDMARVLEALHDEFLHLDTISHTSTTHYVSNPNVKICVLPPRGAVSLRLIYIAST